jgi:uncharacterized membrane protein
MSKKRFWEIDFLRGIAIVNMIIFNYSFALTYLRICNLNLGFTYAALIASTFIFLSGICLTISYNRIKNRRPREVFKKFFFRGLKIFSYGILITIVTYLTFPEAFVIFGILHFIGLSIILGQFFLRFKKLNLLLGLMIIITGFHLKNLRFDFPWLLWLGFTPRNFYTFDYFPLLPWFGITLLGIFFGNVFYRDGKRRFKLRDISNFSVVKLLVILGRNSLFIYLIHQPLLIIILLILGFKIF